MHDDVKDDEDNNEDNRDRVDWSRHGRDARHERQRNLNCILYEKKKKKMTDFERHLYHQVLLKLKMI